MSFSSRHLDLNLNHVSLRSTTTPVKIYLGPLKIKSENLRLILAADQHL